MAVLKSPKNSGTKMLWSKRLSSRVKTTSYYFYRSENLFERSSIKSLGIKNDFTFYAKKYRSGVDVFKEERRRFGKILPSTLKKPERLRPYQTFGAKSWSLRKKFRKEFILLMNTEQIFI